MIKKPITALILTFACGMLAAQGRIVFDGTQWNFGAVKEQEGSVSHTFTFTNTSDEPVVIEHVSSSCGCTSPRYSKAPVKPGGKGSVEITFDPSGRPGVNRKEIFVITDNGRSRTRLAISADVQGRPRTVEDDYPAGMPSGVRLTDMLRAFRYVEQGKARSMTIGYVNTSDKPVRIITSVTPPAPYLVVTSPGEVCAGCRGEITFTVDLTRSGAPGMLSHQVYLMINGRTATVPISITAIGTDNFDGVDRVRAPVIEIDKQFFHMGVVKRGSKPSHTFTITNTGREPLVIRRVQPSKELDVSLREDDAVAPGKSMTFRVGMDTRDAMPGRIFRSVVIMSNDPARPMREVRIVADIE